jgi:hypothetical protein
MLLSHGDEHTDAPLGVTLALAFHQPRDLDG